MRRIRRKFHRPKAPWDSIRIKDEKTLVNDYGLRRKKEIRAAEETLRKFRQRARDLIAVKDEEKEKVLIEKLLKLGMLPKDSTGLDDVLGLSVNNILDRRLQTIVFKKGMAKTAREARQMIVHGHVNIDNRRISFPSYVVTLDEESKIKVIGSKG
jgi:small subunit ribosomal protein S4